LIASGTGGVEIMLKSLFRPGESVLVVSNGKFRDRWADYGQLIGLLANRVETAWGKVVSAEEILTQLNRMKNPKGLVLTHCETSTGAVLDLEEIVYAVKDAYPDVLIVVDGITTIGAQAFYFDDWQIDAAIVASQKALMSPAGLAAYALSEVAKDRLQPSSVGDYMNLHNYVQWAAKLNYPFTPPVTLLYALHAALQFVEAERLPTIWQRTHRAAHHFRAGLAAQYEVNWVPEVAAESLSAFSLAGYDSSQLLTQLKARGFWLSGGQGSLKGKIMRISHMGPLADVDVMEVVLGALQEITAA